MHLFNHSFPPVMVSGRESSFSLIPSSPSVSPQVWTLSLPGCCSSWLSPVTWSSSTPSTCCRGDTRPSRLRSPAATYLPLSCRWASWNIPHLSNPLRQDTQGRVSQQGGLKWGGYGELVNRHEFCMIIRYETNSACKTNTAFVLVDCKYPERDLSRCVLLACSCQQKELKLICLWNWRKH